MAIKNISFALRPNIYFLKYSTNQVLSFGANNIKILWSDKMLLKLEYKMFDIEIYGNTKIRLSVSSVFICMVCDFEQIYLHYFIAKVVSL